MKRAKESNEQNAQSKAARVIVDGSDSDDDVTVIQVTEAGDLIQGQTKLNPSKIKSGVPAHTTDQSESEIIIEEAIDYVPEEVTDVVELSTEIIARDPAVRDAVRIVTVNPSAADSEQIFYAPKVQDQSKKAAQSSTQGTRFPVAMGNTSHSQKAVRSAAMKSSSLLSLMASVAAQSAIASARNATPKKTTTNTEPQVNEAWHEQLKAVPFSEIKAEDVINWINVDAIQKPAESSPHWMLNPCRKVCVFVNFCTDNRGRRAPLYLCNFCKLTESSYSGILQHLNHHLFVCGTCPYYSSTRFDVELHRQRVGHMQPLSDGYIVHKQGTSVSTQKLKTSRQTKHSDITPLLEWLPIQEETESLIIMDADRPPESARRAFFERNPLATSAEIKALDISTSVVCALPYYRFVAGKCNRKHVLEFHCNFCQSTPAFTQELYRHIDFHALDCPAEDCSFRSFTRLELHLHQRQEHLDQAEDFLNDLVVLVPLMSILEENLVQNASMYHAKWNVVLKLPNIAEIPGSGDICEMRNMLKECEYRCTICNLFIINKGGMSSHLKMHNVAPKDIEQYMEPV